MRRILIFVLPLLLTVISLRAAPAPHLVKILPTFLDLKGRNSLSPSLYDRDAYQAKLRQQPENVSGMRFDVQMKAPKTGRGLKLKIELRQLTKGTVPQETTLEKEVKPGGFLYSFWATLFFTGEDYKKFGNVIAWRATLWDGEKLLSEQKSYLW